jgi:hypothetical protein
MEARFKYLRIYRLLRVYFPIEYVSHIRSKPTIYIWRSTVYRVMDQQIILTNKFMLAKFTNSIQE